MSLRTLTTSTASVSQTAGGWHLQVPAGKAGDYRLAQLDDYSALRRSRFPIKAPTTLRLRCSVNEPNHPGTWGFGFWNDPFAFSFGLQGFPRRLPMLPNCCWFFHASEENYLSFAPEVRRTILEETTRLPENDPGLITNSSNQVRRTLAGNGFLAQCFRSPQIPSLLLAPGVVVLPLLFSKILSWWIRAISGKIIGEDSLALSVDVTQWHSYQLTWRESGVAFSVDDALVFETPVSPHGPMGTVIWIDNQYAAWTPEGKVGFGTLQQKATGWMELEQVEIDSE